MSAQLMTGFNFPNTDAKSEILARIFRQLDTFDFDFGNCDVGTDRPSLRGLSHDVRCTNLVVEIHSIIIFRALGANQGAVWRKRRHYEVDSDLDPESDLANSE
jgi:hypothetical protein